MSEASQDSVQLQLSDLVLVLQVLQLAASRSAFKIEEYNQIGGCYERIFAFLAANGVLNSNNGNTTLPADSAKGENQ